MQPLWSLCIHFSERLPEDNFFISFIVFHPCKYAGVLSMQFDDVWRVPQHDFFQELNLLGRLWLFHLCWEATQLMEMDGKTVHLSNIVWQLVGFLNLAILMRQLQAGYQDFVTTCCQLLSTNHWLIWLIWQYHWSTASVHSENPSPRAARAARAARACDRSDGLLGLTLGTSATSTCDTRCCVLQVLDRSSLKSSKIWN